MRERSWTQDEAEQLREVARASLGKLSAGMRGELRAVARALQPTERVRAVAAGGYEVVRAGAPRRRAIAALIVVTDRRLIFAIQRVPYSPGQIEEVAQTELRDGTVQLDGSDDGVVITSDSMRITLRHLLGRDAAEAIARSLSMPHPVPPAPEVMDPAREPDAPTPLMPEPAAATWIGQGSRFRVVKREDPPRHELRADHGVVVAWIACPSNAPARAARAGREWRFDVREAPRGWIGVGEESRSRRELARYRAGWLPGGTLTLDGRKHRVRPALSGAWRVTASRQDVAVLRSRGQGVFELTLGPAVAQLADPLLLATMLVWVRLLEAGMAHHGGG